MRHRHASAQRGHRRRDSSALPLSLVEPGQAVTLADVEAGDRFRKRLGDLGLGVGMTVRVVQNSFPGPLIVATTDDARLAVGRGMAHKIRVTFTDSPTL